MSSAASEARQTPRRDVSFVAWWHIAQFDLSGMAAVRNLSLGGICLQLDKEFPVRPGPVVFSLRSPDIPALPPEATLRWSCRVPRRLGEPPPGFLCGAMFLLGQPAVAEQWSRWFSTAFGDEAGVSPALPQTDPDVTGAE